jgi:4-amino-4-deoxy-L-arabinose transferase-like glycosyltransferase
MNFKIWIFLVLSLLILATLIFSFFEPPSSYQELRRAILVKENIENFKFFQTYNGEPYFTKPPLYTWLASIFVKPFSSDPEGIIFPLRVFSILCYTLLFLSLIEFHQKDWQGAFFSIIVLLTNFRFFSFINRIDLEPLFVLFSFLMFWFSYLYLFKSPKRLYQYLFYLFLIAGIFIRGPLNLFYLPGLLIYSFFTKDKRALKLILNPLGWSIFIVICLSWYGYGYLAFGKGVFQEFFNIDIKARLVSEAKDPWYFYFNHFLLNFWFCFLILFYLFWKEKIYLKERVLNLFSKLREDKELLFLLTISLAPIILLSFTGKKYDKYLLWIYPFFALLISKILIRNFSTSAFLGRLFLIPFLANLIIFGVIAYKNSTTLSDKLQNIKKEIISDHLVFWQKENPIIVFYAPTPIKVLTKEEELLIFLNQGYKIISEERLNQGRLNKSFLDPYKKVTWYVYSS